MVAPGWSLNHAKLRSLEDERDVLVIQERLVADLTASMAPLERLSREGRGTEELDGAARCGVVWCVVVWCGMMGWVGFGVSFEGEQEQDAECAASAVLRLCVPSSVYLTVVSSLLFFCLFVCLFICYGCFECCLVETAQAPFCFKLHVLPCSRVLGCFCTNRHFHPHTTGTTAIIVVETILPIPHKITPERRPAGRRCRAAELADRRRILQAWTSGMVDPSDLYRQASSVFLWEGCLRLLRCCDFDEPMVARKLVRCVDFRVLGCAVAGRCPSVRPQRVCRGLIGYLCARKGGRESALPKKLQTPFFIIFFLA